MAGLEEFERHLLRTGVIKPDDVRPVVDFPPQGARRRRPRMNETEPRRQPALSAVEHPPQQKSFQNLDAILQDGFAAIRPETGDARPLQALAQKEFLLPLGTVDVDWGVLAFGRRIVRAGDFGHGAALI